MTKIQTANYYDLEERTFLFAKNCRDLTSKLYRNVSNIEYTRQLIRSAGSVAANYIEANDSLGKKDFLHKLRISRREAKETRLWLKLLIVNYKDKKEKERLIIESTELVKILSAIIEKSK